jgi:D-threo-aldose 1-dehydrogenase
MISTKVERLLRPRSQWRGEHDDEGFDVPGSVGRVVDFSEAGIRASHAESVKRLGLDRVDILYLHDPERTDLAAGLRHAIPALQAMRDEGIVSAIGAASMSVDALRASADTPGVDLLMVAGPLMRAE